MKIEKTLMAVFLAGIAFIGMGVSLAAYFASPSSFVKESRTSLLIDNYLVLYRNGSRGARVTSMGHSYAAGGAGILEFAGRVYRFVPGYRFEFDASDITTMGSKIIYFINRSKADDTSPVAAAFEVFWEIEGKGKNKSKIVESGYFRGSTTDSPHASLPREMKSFREEIEGKDEFYLNFTQLDAEFADDSEGKYTLEMRGSINYTFIPWSGYTSGNKKNYMVFKADVSYMNGTHTRINLYYPVNFFTENVRITHPVLVKLKQILGRY